MRKYLYTTLIHLAGIVGIFVLGGFLLSYPVAAVDCTVPISGNMTISSPCTFPGTINGTDAGTGTTNTAVLSVSGGATLTIAAGQTISTGSLVPGTGSIAIITGGQIKLGTPLWMTDADTDGYPASSTQIAQASTPTGGRRRNVLSSFTDRNDSNSAAYESRPLLDSAGSYSGWTGSDANVATLSTDNSTTYLSSIGAMKAVMTGVNSGTGADGALSVTSGTTTINTTLSGSAVGSAGGTTMTVSSTSGFAAGNEVFIIQTTGTGAGNYEYKTISAVNSGTQVTFTTALTNAYNGSTAQMIKVPQYTTVSISSGATLTAPAWNGSTGGVLVFRATGTVTVDGTVDGNGKGYIGGNNTDTVGGYQGKSYPSLNVSITRNANAGGGGGGSPDTIGWERSGGGAGGGYGVGGSNGGNGSCCATLGQGGTGGGAYGITNLTTLFLGSGGGGGGNMQNGPAGDGGTGGGVVVIMSNALTINAGGAIQSNGTTGGSAYNKAGGGGGGSGGSVFIQSSTITGANLITASAGSGGSGGPTGGGGGGNGGVGRIRCDNSAANCTTTTPTAYSVALPSPQNVTMNRTLPAPLDISGINHVSFWVNSAVTGSVLRFQMGEAAATEQTFDFSVSAANTWEEKDWDISAISAASRDAIRYMQFKYLSGTAGTFRIDGLTYYE